MKAVCALSAGALLLVVSVSLLAGCHTWNPSQVPQPNQSLAGAPKNVRVVLNDGTAIVLRNPYMASDTLFGEAYNGLIGTPVRRGIPAGQIKAIDYPQFSVLRTAGLSLALAAVAFVIIGYMVVIGDPNY